MNGEAQNLGKGEDSRIWRTVFGFPATHHPCFIMFLLLLELPLWDEPCLGGVVPCFPGTLKLPNKTKLSPLMPFASCVFLCFAGLKAENPATRLHSSADLGPGMGKACHNPGHVSTCQRLLMIDDACGWPSSKALLSRIFSLDSGRFLLTAKGCPSSFFSKDEWPDLTPLVALDAGFFDHGFLWISEWLLKVHNFQLLRRVAHTWPVGFPWNISN